MVRKVTFILFLLSLLIAFFYFRPLLTSTKPQPSLMDRMPDGDFIGKLNVLSMAKESNAMVYFNKIPFRDLITPEFLLAQGKSYGLDFQRPSYFFTNMNGEWGALIHVTDSSKIYSGIVRLKKKIDLQERVAVLNASAKGDELAANHAISLMGAEQAMEQMQMAQAVKEQQLAMHQQAQQQAQQQLPSGQPQ